MEVLFFVVCESVEIVGSRVNVIGILDSLAAPSMPAQFSKLTIVFKLSLGEEDQDTAFHFAIRVIDADGGAVFEDNVDEIKAPEGTVPRGLHAGFHQQFEIMGLVLPLFGEYSVDLLLDGEPVARWPLRFLPLPK